MSYNCTVTFDLNKISCFSIFFSFVLSPFHQKTNYNWFRLTKFRCIFINAFDFRHICEMTFNFLCWNSKLIKSFIFTWNDIKLIDFTIFIFFFHSRLWSSSIKKKKCLKSKFDTFQRIFFSSFHLCVVSDLSWRIFFSVEMCKVNNTNKIFIVYDFSYVLQCSSLVFICYKDMPHTHS